MCIIPGIILVKGLHCDHDGNIDYLDSGEMEMILNNWIYRTMWNIALFNESRVSDAYVRHWNANTGVLDFVWHAKVISVFDRWSTGLSPLTTSVD